MQSNTSLPNLLLAYDTTKKLCKTAQTKKVWAVIAYWVSNAKEDVTLPPGNSDTAWKQAVHVLRYPSDRESFRAGR